MEMVLLVVTVVSLVIALVMSVTAWRVTRDEKHRSAARVAALSVSAFAHREPPEVPRAPRDAEGGSGRQAKAPWAPAPEPVTRSLTPAPRPHEMVRDDEGRALLNVREPVHEVSYSSGFLASALPPQAGGTTGRQRSLALAAMVLFVGLATGLVWMMSEPRGSTAAAVGPNMPLELVSLRHDRRDAKLAVSGLVRNPVTGQPVERLSAVVFLFDQQGTFVMSATSPVDFIKLGLGDESPFVVALDAPPGVARYRVSFRTDDGVVPHIDRRGAAPVAAGAEQPVSVTLK